MTGAPSFTLGLCLRKDVVGAVLRDHGVAVPESTVIGSRDPEPRWRSFPAIVKPVADDGSYGIRGDAVVRDPTELAAALRRGHARWDRLLVQRFVSGREFTLAIVGDEILPHAEADFQAFPPDLPPIVTYAAKWEHGSPEERSLAIRCPAPLPARAARRLTALARRVWSAVEGEGYGRIDVRADPGGTFYVVDVNPNPDLSPRVGLSAQAAVAGWTYVDLIARIVADALARRALPGPAGRSVEPPRPARAVGVTRAPAARAEAASPAPSRLALPRRAPPAFSASSAPGGEEEGAPSMARGRRAR